MEIPSTSFPRSMCMVWGVVCRSFARLQGARLKAASYSGQGYKGAMFPWESAYTGMCGNGQSHGDHNRVACCESWNVCCVSLCMHPCTPVPPIPIPPIPLYPCTPTPCTLHPLYPCAHTPLPLCRSATPAPVSQEWRCAHPAPPRVYERSTYPGTSPWP